MPPTRPPEFKDEAIRLMRSSGKPLAQISRELDVSEQTLRNWRKQQQIDEGEREGITTEEWVELSMLRREVKVLRQEKEILRKAAAEFDARGNTLRRLAEGREPPTGGRLRAEMLTSGGRSVLKCCNKKGPDLSGPPPAS